MNFWSRKPKPVGHGPSGSLLVVEPDQDRKNFKNSWTESDQDREKFTNLGMDRTRTKKILKISDRFGSVGPWSPGRKDPSKYIGKELPQHIMVPRIFKFKTMPLQNFLNLRVITSNEDNF